MLGPRAAGNNTANGLVMHIAGKQGLRMRAAIAGTAFALTLGQAGAAILTVGKGQMYKNPKAAAAAAHRGDTIEIFPGTYGGAVWYNSDITIMGMGSGATITGKVLMGKGLFDIEGNNVTVKNLTFAGAKVGDGNGSGIRADGTNLTILNSHFNSNQDGILAGDNAASTITVMNSTFNHNGACVGACAHALYVGRIAKLDVENSTFTDTQRGHSIKSRALNTMVINNRISDGANGTSSYLIDVARGGAVTITGNTLEKGPKSSNATYAITIGEEGPYAAQGPMLIANNTYRNDRMAKGVFVRNTTGFGGLVLSNNTLTGNKTILLQGAGAVTASATTLATVAALDVGRSVVFQAPRDPAAADPPGGVPEPSTVAVFGALLAGLAWFLRSRQR
jgi:hypothetical protein